MSDWQIELIEFFKDSIEMHGGNVEAFYELEVFDEDELAERLECYLDHLVYQIKTTFYSQNSGFVEATKQVHAHTELAACVVNNTYDSGYVVIVYHKAKPLMDSRYSSLNAAYDELIHLGFTQAKENALEEHLAAWS
jgi:hypothetical protein